MATNPLAIISDELSKRFRKWIETLTLNTNDRPLKNLIKDGKILNFNYTEFIEQLYNVSELNICYIHGCRKKKKCHPKEKLILGHMLGASDCQFEFKDKNKIKKSKRALVEIAVTNAFQNVIYCDESSF